MRVLLLASLLSGWLLLAASAIEAAAAPGSATIRVKPLGLGPAELKLVNRGDWPGAAKRLETIAAGGAGGCRAQAWLGFAYLYLGRCDDLKSLAGKVGDGQTSADKAGAAPTAREERLCAAVVRAFDAACQDKPDEAEKELAPIKDEADKDALASFALAAVAGKKRQAAQAIAYCHTTVELAPNFAWGWRTIGFLEERWLKNQQRAEEAFSKALAIESDFPEVRDLLVDLRLSRNDFDGAIDVARDGIKANPRDAGSYYRLAQIYTQQWRLSEALGQLDKAITIYPDDARFHRSKASILRYQGKLDYAIAEQQKAVDLAKDKPFELVELAALNSAAGNNNKAADNLRQALQLTPGNQAIFQKLAQILYQERRWDDLVNQYKTQIQRQPKDAALRLGLAKALKAANRVEEARQELVEAANLAPADPAPHRELGGIYVQQKDYAAAAREYTRALNINPSSTEDLVALGFCYANNDDYLQAETAFVTAIALQQLTQMTGQASQGNLSDVMRSLALLFLTEGRYSEACVQLEAIAGSPRATALDRFWLAEARALRDRSSASVDELNAAYDRLSDVEKNAQRLAFVETLLKLGKTDAAVTALDMVPQELQVSHSRWLTARAELLRLKGELKKAQEVATQAAALKEGGDAESESHIEVARIALDEGDLSLADSEARRAIELNPKSFAGYEVLGRIYWKRGDPEHAIEAGKKALEINPYHTQAYLLLGDAQLSSGKLKDAASNYRRAADLYPGLIDTHKALLSVYQKLSMKDEASKEAEQIAQMEKRQ